MKHQGFIRAEPYEIARYHGPGTPELAFGADAHVAGTEEGDFPPEKFGNIRRFFLFH
jgi:hypothetical protein